MTVETAKGAAAAPEQSAEPEAPKPSPPAQEADWKAEARKWEQRAKANADAATRLAEIEGAAKSDAQRAAEAATAAETRAAEAEARSLRLEVAIEHSLSKEDAALLDGMTSEDAMRALAARLAAAATPPAGGTAPMAGITPKDTPDAEDRRAFLRALTGRD